MIGADRETLAESKLSAVEAAVSVYTPQVDTVIKASPTPTQANVATEQYNLTKTLANLPKYGSPSEVARRAFVEDISQRAGAALGIGVVAAIAAGVIALWVLRK
jgi:hypothetical protein